MEALIQAAKRPEYPTRINLVISDNPLAAGLTLAQRLHVPTEVIPYESRQIFEASLRSILCETQTHYVCLAGFMRILSPDFLRNWSHVLNIHPSLLPAYPGLHTHQRAIADQQSKTGCTVHLVTPKLDAGPILAQREVPILPTDTPDTLAARVLEHEHILYPQALADYVALTNQR